jgi:hypothetical protein
MTKLSVFPHPQSNECDECGAELSGMHADITEIPLG